MDLVPKAIFYLLKGDYSYKRVMHDLKWYVAWVSEGLGPRVPEICPHHVKHPI